MPFKGKYRFMMMRHGESIWNKNSTFTGWTDIYLTQNGKMEAYNASQKIKNLNIKPTLIHTSSLYRAINTSEIINKEFNVPIYKSWRLNEKHYGSIEGLSRNYIRSKFGKEYTEKMRSDFYMFPPLVDKISEEKSKFSVHVNSYLKDKLKTGESKKCVYNRLIPYWNNLILPSIMKNELPLIVTHKHTGRALMKKLLNLNDEEFANYKFPDKKILCVSLDQNCQVIQTHLIDYGN